MSKETTNRLANEKSPYLQQHKHNPVDWYPWGEEAFAAARAADKPIMLSVGYSTCHWCHVMERECFETADVAEALNRVFVCIKVDREERPDIDAVYMSVCQMMTGSGGWPMNIFMMPDGAPFLAATYIPRLSQYGRMGLIDLANRIGELWLSDRSRLAETGQQVLSELAKPASRRMGHPPMNAVRQGVAQFAAQFDEKTGGFGAAPRFPCPQNIIYLLTARTRYADDTALSMASRTLVAMRLGGLWDHVEGGFHRYSTDDRWLLPHFEKMLYDQAMMLYAYTAGWAVTRDDLFRSTALDIANYIANHLTAPAGGFYCGEDADSDGEEGLFHTWSYDELTRALPPEDLVAAMELFNMSPNGNFSDEASGRASGRNIPHLTRRPGDRASEASRLTGLLRLVRDRRPRPHRDEKVLADWNGLASAALAFAGRVLGASMLVEQARCSTEFVLREMVREDGRLLHRWAAGEASIPGFLDDYAFLGLAALELHLATGHAEYLEKAQRLADEALALFSESDGSLRMTGLDADRLIALPRESHDAAMPSGNSAMAFLLARLGTALESEKYREAAMHALRPAFDGMSRMPTAFAYALLALDHLLNPSWCVKLQGRLDLDVASAMREVLCRQWVPGLHWVEYPTDLPPTAQPCRSGACAEPISSAQGLGEFLVTAVRA